MPDANPFLTIGVTFLALLLKLDERQDWCPYCGAEYGHNGNCYLSPYWDHGMKDEWKLAIEGKL